MKAILSFNSTLSNLFVLRVPINDLFLNYKSFITIYLFLFYFFFENERSIIFQLLMLVIFFLHHYHPRGYCDLCLSVCRIVSPLQTSAPLLQFSSPITAADCIEFNLEIKGGPGNSSKHSKGLTLSLSNKPLVERREK